MSRSVREYLQHILDETRYLLDQAQVLDKDTFLEDETEKLPNTSRMISGNNTTIWNGELLLACVIDSFIVISA